MKLQFLNLVLAEISGISVSSLKLNTMEDNRFSSSVLLFRGSSGVQSATLERDLPKSH